MDARIERRVRALRGFSGERARDQRALEQRLHFKERRQCARRGELGAVEQREPFLWREREGLEPGEGERFRRWQSFAAIEHVTHTDQRGGHVGQRREITRCADRTLRRNHRRDSARQDRAEQGRGLQTNARCALRETRELERDHQSGDGYRQRLTYAGTVRQHDVSLERREVVVFDAHLREAAEPRIDAVDGLVSPEDALNRGGALRDARGAGFVQRSRFAAIDGAPLREADFTGFEYDAHWPFQTRACSGL